MMDTTTPDGTRPIECVDGPWCVALDDDPNLIIHYDQTRAFVDCRVCKEILTPVSHSMDEAAERARSHLHVAEREARRAALAADSHTIAIIAATTITDTDAVESIVSTLVRDHDVLLTCGAHKGGEMIASRWARGRGIIVRTMAARYDDPQSEDPVGDRNAELVRSRPHGVIALRGSKPDPEVEALIDLAARSGLKVVVATIETTRKKKDTASP